MIQQGQVVMMPIRKPRKRSVGDVIPSIFPAILATFQLILWLAIIGLETGSIYYDAGRGTVYAGFWCSFVFFVTWVSMFSYLCCGKSSGCGIYLFVQNIINLVFAIILIAFTARFVNNPCLCYSTLCNVPSWDSISDLYTYPFSGDLTGACTARTLKKLPVLKGLLSCAVLLLVSNIIFIVVYIIIYIRVRVKSPPDSQIQSTNLPPYQPSPMIYSTNQYQQSYVVQAAPEPHYYSSTIETIPRDETPSAPIRMRSEKF